MGSAVVSTALSHRVVVRHDVGRRGALFFLFIRFRFVLAQVVVVPAQISQADLTVNEVDGSNRVSEPSERTVKKIDGRDIKRTSKLYILTILYLHIYDT